MQYSTDIIGGAREITARIKVILEERQASLDSVLTAFKARGVNAERYNTKDLTNGAAMEDVLELYNAIAGLFLKPSNTSSTKTAINKCGTSNRKHGEEYGARS